MSYNPQNPNGQATMANSEPVVLASDQTDVKITLDGETVAIASSALPTGASTSANQTTIIGHLDGVEGLLTTIDGDTGNISTKIDTIAGAVSGTEMQVDVITMPTVTVQATNLDVRDLAFATDKVDISGSSSVGVTGTFFQATQPVSGTVTANAGTNLNTSALALEATLQSVKTAVETIDNAISGSEMQVDVITMPTVTISDGGGSITVDGTVAITGAGDATAANQTTIIGHVDGIENLLTTIDSDTGNISTKIDTLAGAVSGTEMQVDIISMPTVTVTGGLTDAELRATPVPISGTITANAGTNLNTSALALETTLSAINTKTPTLGQTTMTNSSPVTLASDQGVIAVGDGGSSITVDSVNLDIRDLTFAADKVDASGTVLGAGTNNIGDVDVLSLPSIPAGNNNIGDVDIASIAAGTNYIGKARLTDGVTDAEVVPLAGYNAQAVAIVDASGNQVTSFGGGTQYTEGDTDATITGTAILMEGAANTLLPIQGTVADGLLVNLGSNNDVTITGSVAVTATDLDIRNLVFATDKIDASGTVLGAGTNNIGDVDVLSVIPGTGSTNLGKAEDTGYTTGDTGVMVLGVSNEGGTALVNANLDYTPQAVDKMGQLYINPENIKVLFRGRSSTFRTPGRAGTAGQKILAVHNATGSSITVKINKVVVDMWPTVVKAVTVAPPIIRIWKFTAVPTNGTALTKNKIGGTTTSNASCTVWGDASADGTGSATTLTVTLPAGTILDQLVCPRVITAVGEVDTNPMKFEYDAGIQLGALEGVCVFLDYTLATQNPTTDMWVASVEFEEFTT